MFRASYVLVLFLSTILGGCITSQVTGDKIYKDHVQHWLVSKDEKYFVVIGDRQHYVLELTDQVKLALQAPYRSSIDLRVPLVDVSADGATKVAYTMILDKGISQQNKDAAILDGFNKEHGFELITTGTLSGKRYERVQLPETSMSGNFSNVHEILVVERLRPGERMARAALSPVTATADGLLLLFGAPLFAAHVMVNGHE